MSVTCYDTSLDLTAAVAIVVRRSERPLPVTDGLCRYGVAQRSMLPDHRYHEQAAKLTAEQSVSHKHKFPSQFQIGVGDNRQVTGVAQAGNRCIACCATVVRGLGGASIAVGVRLRLCLAASTLQFA